MRIIWKDVFSSALAVLGGVVVFAKLESYSWWLIGSWKGAIGVLAVIGLGIAFTNIVDFVRMADLPTVGETALWLLAATVAFGSVLTDTTKGEFISVAVLVGLSWLAQLTRDVWVSAHNHGAKLVTSH